MLLMLHYRKILVLFQKKGTVTELLDVFESDAAQ